MIRILLVDDQPVVRTGFRLILQADTELDVVGEAGDGREAITQVTRLRPDVVLMDIRMPDVDGLEATRRITALPGQPAARVLVLTTFDLDEYVFEALRSGASGFLLKTITAQELRDAVRVVAGGEGLLAPQVTRRLIEEFTRLSIPEVPLGTDLGRLTPREREVLVLIARGLSNGEIAEALYLGESTVRTHVNRVLAKLGLRDRVQAAIAAYEAGLVRPRHP